MSAPDELPRHVEILGKRWSIRRRKSKKDLGSCDHNRLVLYYDPNQPLPELRDTILHEFMHAVTDQMSLGLSEKQIAGTATLLLHALRANRSLVEFFLAE